MRGKDVAVTTRITIKIHLLLIVSRAKKISISLVKRKDAFLMVKNLNQNFNQFKIFLLPEDMFLYYILFQNIKTAHGLFRRSRMTYWNAKMAHFVTGSLTAIAAVTSMEDVQNAPKITQICVLIKNVLIIQITVVVLSNALMRRGGYVVCIDYHILWIWAFIIWSGRNIS